VPVLGLVENFRYFMCPHRGDRLEAERLGTEFLGAMLLGSTIRETSDRWPRRGSSSNR
jgi:Mrp family chromosome partitioning ATPase